MTQNESAEVKHLIHQLKHDPDVFTRVKAAQKLADYPDIDSALALVEALNAKSTMVGTSATLHLVGRGDISSTAADSLLVLAPKITDPNIIKPLLQFLQDESEFTRKVAFIILCRLPQQIQNDVIIEALIKIQPQIDIEVAGHPIVTLGNTGNTASEEILALLTKLKSKGKPEPFLYALNSKEPQVVIFGAKTLFEMEQVESAIKVLKNCFITFNVFDSIFTELDNIDQSLAMKSLILLLREGSPWICVYAARKLKKYPDNEAIEALSKWNNDFQKISAKISPKCDSCGRDPSQTLNDGSYWCSWCGRGFTLEDVYISNYLKK